MQLAIFDLDGVIVDTSKYHYLAWRRLSEELKIHFTEKDNERLKGVSRMRSLDIILELGQQYKTPEEKRELAAKKNAWYLEYIERLDSSEILPGVLPFLDLLREKGIKIALGSASKNAPLIMKRLGLTAMFHVIIDGNSVAKAKPDPEVFLLAAEALNISPRRCVVFEDAQAGIEAGLRAGMTTVGIGDPKILSAAHYVLPGFNGLNGKQFIKQLQGGV